MIIPIIDKTTAKRYWKLINISRAQLTYIADRLSNPPSRINTIRFLVNNWRIKQVINSIIWHKQKTAGANSIKEMVDELDHIEHDTLNWGEVGPEEIDYIKLVFNGIHDISEYAQLLDEGPSCH